MNPLTNPETWEAFKSHPLTQAYFSFLKERQSDLSRAWGEGVPLGEAEQAQARTLHQLVTMNCADVRRFYDMPEPEVEDADEQ